MCKYTSAKLGSPKLILRVTIPACTKPTREGDEIKINLDFLTIFIHLVHWYVKYFECKHLINDDLSVISIDNPMEH